MKQSDPKAIERFLAKIACELERQNAELRTAAEGWRDPGVFADACAFRPIKTKPAPRTVGAVRA